MWGNPMSPDDRHPARIVAPFLVGTALLLLPLVYHPGFGLSDLLPKRMVLYVAAVGLSFLGIWSRLSAQVEPARSPLWLPASAYVMVNVLSLAWSTNRFSGLVEATQLIVLLIFLYTITQLIEFKGIRVWAQLSTLGAVMLSLIGIAQYSGIGLEILAIPSVGLPSGTFVFRNLAASYLVGALPFGFYVLITESDNRRGLLWGLSLVIISLFLVFTRTRGAWLGLVLGSLCALALAFSCGNSLRTLKFSVSTFLQSRYRVYGLCTCLALFAAGLLLPNHSSREVIQRFDEQKSTTAVAVASIVKPGSDRGRFAMWRHTLEMIVDHPILGVGLDNWEYAYPLYDKGDPEGKITSASEPVRPHNDYLWIASELGLLGLLAFLWLIIATVKLAVGTMGSNKASVRALTVCSVLGIFSLLGHGLFSFPKEQPASAGLFWIHLSALGALSPERGRGRNKAWVLHVLTLLVSAFALVLNWRHMAFDVSYNRAQAYAARQQWLPAVRLMDIALEQGPFDHRASFLKARYAQHVGSRDAAISAYREALESHPNYAHTHHNLGVLLAGTAEWDQAISSFTKALSIRPGYTQARIHLGNVYIQTNRVVDAIGEYRVVVQEWPDSPEARATLGTLLLQQGQLEDAVSHLRKATTLKAGFVDALNNLGLALEKSGMLNEAVEAYERVLLNWSGSTEDRENLRRHVERLRTQMNTGE